MIKGIHHVCMKCGTKEEFEKVKDFYVNTLGLSLCREWVTGVMIDTGGGLLEIFNNAPSIETQGMLRHVALATDDVYAAVEKVKEAGYAVFDGPRDVEIPSDPVYPARIAFFNGPLGEEIELFQEL